MNTKSIVCVSAAVAVFGLAGCGSDSTTEATSTSATTETSASSTAAPSATSSPAGTPPAPAAETALTITDYLKTADITETPVSAGDPAAPKIEFPMPAGWEQAIDVPGKPFWAVVLTQAAAPENPPLIEARLSKLSADVPVDKIFEYAPGELKNMPGFEAMGDGGRDQLAGLEAHQYGGFYNDNGTQELVAQKTLLIPTDNGLFLLRVRATGPEDDAQALITATAELDDKTVITP